MPSEYIVDVSSDQFEEEVISFSETTPVIVEFRAKWSGPCRMLDRIFDEMIPETEGAFRLVRLDTDKIRSTLIDEYKVKHIPDIRVFYKGQIISGFRGFKDKEFLSGFFTRVLEKIKNNYE